MAVATELVTKFSFLGSLNPLKLFNADLAGGLLIIREFGGAVVDLAKEMQQFIDQPLQGAASLAEFSRQTGISANTVQELGFAASQLGSDVGAVQSTLESLQQKIGEASLRGSEDFARLGISVRDSSGRLKNADQILNEVRVRFQQLNLSLAEQRSFASALGIDPSLIQLLGQSTAELSELRQEAKRLGVVTDEQAEAALDYKNAVTSLKFSTAALQNQIAVGLAPEMTELSEKYQELISDNKDFISEGVEKAASALGSLADAFVRLAPFLAAAGVLFIGAKIAAIGFGTVVGAIFSPVVLIGAAIAGTLLLLDDLIVAFNGGKSVVADFFDSFFGAGATQQFLQEFVEGFKIGLDAIQGFFAGLLDYFVSIFTLDFQRAANIVESGVAKIADFFGFGGEDTLVPAGASAGGSTVSNNNVSQQNTFNIVSNDPQAVAGAVTDSLQGQLDNAEAQINRGGR